MRLSEKQIEILKLIGIGTIVLSSFFAPNMIRILKIADTHKKYQFKKRLNKLIKDDCVYLFGDEVHLTKKGKELLKIIQVREIEISKPDKWDRMWHLVCYDIPEIKKKERNFFREKLVTLGFKIIQDSLWVHPYECRQEIAVISQHLSIAPYVAYLNTSYLPGQSKLLKHFELDDI